MEKLVIFGGTFDPIHNGHLAIARAASLIVGADVVFVPAKTPPWKKTKATSSQRLEMVKLALKQVGFHSFSVDTFEMDSDNEVNYSIDTVKYFANKYPDKKLYFLIGADQVNAFPKWKDSKEIIEYAHLLYVGRPDYPINDDIVKEYDMIRLPYDELHAVSSSDVRDFKNYEIPGSVSDYIEENKLYYIEKISTYLTDKRLKHSISVAHLAYQIALSNGIPNPKKAYAAGLLHDIGKYVNESAALEIMRERYSAYLYLKDVTYHQFIGAYLVEKDFDIHDEEIVEAIKFHTTGKPHATAIGKILYCSDKIEPTRPFDSRSLIKACIDNYYVGFLEVLKANIAYFKAKGIALDEEISKEFYTLYCGEGIWTN